MIKANADIRALLKEKKVPAIYVNNRALINLPLLLESLNESSRKNVEQEAQHEKL